MKTTTQVRKSFKMGPHLDRSLLERSHFPHCKALDLQVRKATLYCSRLRISRTAAKPSLHHVRGIVCCTHSCGLQCHTPIVSFLTQPYPADQSGGNAAEGRRWAFEQTFERWQHQYQQCIPSHTHPSEFQCLCCLCSSLRPASG